MLSDRLSKVAHFIPVSACHISHIFACIADNPKQECSNLLGLLLAQQQTDDGNALSDEEVIDEVIMFYLVCACYPVCHRHTCVIIVCAAVLQAGHETSTNCLTFTLQLIASHPDVATKMYEEIVAVCGTSGQVTWDHVHELGYGCMSVLMCGTVTAL
jgi:hypothetical protein